MECHLASRFHRHGEPGGLEASSAAPRDQGHSGYQADFFEKTNLHGSSNSVDGELDTITGMDHSLWRQRAREEGHASAALAVAWPGLFLLHMAHIIDHRGFLAKNRSNRQ